MSFIIIYYHLTLPTISIPFGISSCTLSTHFLDAQSIDEGVVLTEVEDAFLTAAAYNKQPEMLKCMEIDPNVVHVSVDGRLIPTPSTFCLIKMIHYYHKTR